MINIFYQNQQHTKGLCACFRSGNLDLKYAWSTPRLGRPIVEKVKEIFRKIKEDRYISSNDFAAKLALKALNKNNNKWVTYDKTVQKN